MQWSLHLQNQKPAEGYSGNRASPMAIGAAVAVHILMATLVLSMPGIKITEVPRLPIQGYNIPLPKDPPPDEPLPPEQKLPRESGNHTAPVTPSALGSTPDHSPTFDNSNQWVHFDGPELPPVSGDFIAPPPSIWVDAQPDRRYLSDFQPDYPGTMVRAGIEGFAKVKASIATDGHVQSVELIDATNPAFWEATRRQALRRWRFKPATRDGPPVASEKIMTVRFRLDDLR